MPSGRAARLLCLPLALLAACGGEPDPPPEPQPPPRVDARDPLAKLPEPRYIDQDEPACCPGLYGGWQHPYVVAPGEEVRATLSTPGGGTDPPPPVAVNAEVVFRVASVTATGHPLHVVRERRVHVDTVEEVHEPYLTLRLPGDAPAWYAFEIEIRPDGDPAERYVSYAYVPEQRADAALSLDRASARPGETLRLTIENRGPAPIEYGLAYRLERWEGEWRWLNRDDVYAAIAKGIEPGRRDHEKITLPDDLEPGRYRIVKSFTGRGVRRSFDAAVQFDVR